MTRQQPLALTAAICSAKFCKSMTGQMSGAWTRVLWVVDVETLIADKINICMQTLWWSQQHYAILYLPSQQNMKLSSPSVSCIVKGSVKIQECFSAAGMRCLFTIKVRSHVFCEQGAEGLIRAGRGWSQAGLWGWAEKWLLGHILCRQL